MRIRQLLNESQLTGATEETSGQAGSLKNTSRVGDGFTRCLRAMSDLSG